MRHDVGVQPLEMLRRERLVDLPPPDALARAGLLHEELVVRAAARVRRGDGAERPVQGDHTLPAPHRVLVELGGREVPVHRQPRSERDGGGERHGDGLRRCSRASTAAMTAIFTISGTSDPRCKTWTGRSMPTTMGPIACASPRRSSSLYAMLAASRLGKISTLAALRSLAKGYVLVRMRSTTAVSACISPSTCSAGSRSCSRATARCTLSAAGCLTDTKLAVADAISASVSASGSMFTVQSAKKNVCWRKIIM